MKTHIRDIRLFNNAGMSFPVCKAGEALLDLDASAWPMAHGDEATCKRCHTAFKRRYPWAVRGGEA